MDARLIGGFIALSMEATFVVGLLVVALWFTFQFASAGDLVGIFLFWGVICSMLFVAYGVALLILDYMLTKEK